jgi:hypothetical protein
MGVQTSEVGYTSATTGRGDHEVHKGHVVGKKIYIYIFERSNRGVIQNYAPLLREGSQRTANRLVTSEQ